MAPAAGADAWRRPEPPGRRRPATYHTVLRLRDAHGRARSVENAMLAADDGVHPHRRARAGGEAGSAAQCDTTGQDEEEVEVALLGVKACNTGVSFTAANYAIFAELMWTPGDMRQAEDRIHRMGQTSPKVYCDVFICKNSYDERHMRLLQSKDSTRRHHRHRGHPSSGADVSAPPPWSRSRRPRRRRGGGPRRCPPASAPSRPSSKPAAPAGAQRPARGPLGGDGLRRRRSRRSRGSCRRSVNARGSAQDECSPTRFLHGAHPVESPPPPRAARRSTSTSTRRRPRPCRHEGAGAVALRPARWARTASGPSAREEDHARRRRGDRDACRIRKIKPWFRGGDRPRTRRSRRSACDAPEPGGRTHPTPRRRSRGAESASSPPGLASTRAGHGWDT